MPGAAVARVVVDVPHAHLDRPFDYAVPDSLDAAAVPGSRVRVRFAGVLRNGFVLERVARSDHEGRLSPLQRVLTPEPILTQDLHRLLRGVADHYAGTLADLLRLAVPPRHARGERRAAAREDSATGGHEGGRDDLWRGYPTGAALLQALRQGTRPRAVWSAPPGPAWPRMAASLLCAARAAGGGACMVLPGRHELRQAIQSLPPCCAAEAVELHAELSAEARYRRWLRLRRGDSRLVLGTRSAVYAPVADLGLLLLWDDGNDLHAERQAPYPHAREVALLRSHQQRTAVVVGAHARTAECQRLVETGWARSLEPTRDALRGWAPLVRATGDEVEAVRDVGARSARVPSLAWRAVRDGLSSGPVLVQVPRRGYIPGLRCGGCGGPARCPRCAGPLGMTVGRALRCRWCGTPGTFSCADCGHTDVRAVSVGSVRTHEELSKAFPRARVLHSDGEQRLDVVPEDPAIVVSTPGAEPVAAEGYAAAVIVDGWASLSLPVVAASQEALRRWMAAASLVRPQPAGGRVVIVADPRQRAVQALSRWDPSWAAERELSERRELNLPPVQRLAEIVGDTASVAGVLSVVSLLPDVEVLGPVPLPEGEDGATQERALVRTDVSRADRLTSALGSAVAEHSRSRAAGRLRVRVDPVDLGW
jgi:primosomal protein N' (replication factor Y)